MKAVFVDSDIFVRDLRYPRDPKTAANKKFLDKMGREFSAVTSIFNLLEICGILSFQLNEQELIDLYRDFTHHYRVKILFPATALGEFRYDVPSIFDWIQKRQSLGDAQVSYVVASFSDRLKSFVSWNKRHYAGKFEIPVLSPDDYG